MERLKANDLIIVSRYLRVGHRRATERIHVSNTIDCFFLCQASARSDLIDAEISANYTAIHTK